jgi:glycogen(starch) synthase
MMRIVHVTDNYLPFVGGLERAVHSVSRLHVDAGHEVHVVTAQPGGQAEVETIDGVVVHRLALALSRIPGAFAAPGRVFFPTISDPVFGLAFSRLLGEVRPDVVHGHGWSTYSIMGPARRAGIPVVNTAHDYGQVCAVKTLLRDGAPCDGPALGRCLSCAYRSYGSKGIPLTLGLRYSGHRLGGVRVATGLSGAVVDAGSAPRHCDRRPMRVVPSFVPDDVLTEAKGDGRPPFVPAAGDYLLYVGAVGVHKGVGVLLDAYRRLRARGVDVPLVLVGKAHGEALDVSGDGVVHHHGAEHRAVMAAWRHAAVGVVPSLWSEPFGQVAVECLAAATPAVVSATGGLADIVEHGVQGTHVPPGDPVALADAITSVLADPGLRRRLACAGPMRAAQFTVSAIAPRIEAIYREVRAEAGVHELAAP